MLDATARTALMVAPHVLPVGGTLQLHHDVGPVVLVAGAGAAHDLPFSEVHDVWKFQLEVGADRYVREPLQGWSVGGRVIGVVWDDVPFLGGDHLGVKGLVGHRWTWARATVGVSGGLVARLYLGPTGEGFVLYPGEFVLPTAELTVGLPLGPRCSRTR